MTPDDQATFDEAMRGLDNSRRRIERECAEARSLADRDRALRRMAVIDDALAGVRSLRREIEAEIEIASAKE
jgi:hypothetical protein